MVKKMMLLAVSAAAFVAFAVPAMASAAVVTTGETTVFATSENTVSSTTAGELKCTTVNLAIDLTENTATTAHGDITGTAEGKPSKSTHTGPCEDPQLGGADVTITSIGGTIHLNAGGKGTAQFVFAFDVLGFPCELEGAGNVTWTPGTNEIHLAGGLSGSSAAPCPTGPEAGSIAGDFTVATEAGTPVNLD